MKIKQIVILVGVLLGFTFAASVMADEVYLHANFDDKPLNTTIGTGGPTAGEPVYLNPYILARVRNNAMPTPCLELTDNDNYSAGLARFEFLDGQEVTSGHCIVAANLWFDEFDLFYFHIREQGTSTHAFCDLDFNSAGEIWYDTAGGSYGLIGSYVTNRYYSVWIDFDMDAGTFNLWFDFSLLLYNKSFGSTIHGVGAILAGTTNDANTGDSFYIDDIYVADHYAPYLFLQANFNNKTINAPIGTSGFEFGEPMNVDPVITAIVRNGPHPTPTLELQDIDDYSAGYARFEFLKDAEVIGGDLYILAHLWFDVLDDYTMVLRENQGGAAESFLTLRFGSSGNIVCADEGGTVGYFGPYQTGRNYEILAVYDLDLGTYDIFWDGELVINDEPHDVVQAGIGSVAFGCMNDDDYIGRFYVDNIFVWQVPTPTMAVCCMDTDCGVMIPMDCAYNAGAFHPEWTSCTPNFCNPAAVDETLSPHVTLLLPPAPNPFTRSTTLQYQLAGPGPVRIEIYDAAGRLVRSLLNGYQESGQSRVEWDGCNASGARVGPGVYFGRLLTGNDAVSQRMIVLK